MFLFSCLLPLSITRLVSCSSGTGGVIPSPMVPGMLPPNMQHLQMGSAMNYLGQPITAGQIPNSMHNGQGLADFNSISAAYAMQGMQMPGIMSTAGLIHPNPALLFNNNEIPNGMSGLPSKIWLNTSHQREPKLDYYYRTQVRLCWCILVTNLVLMHLYYVQLRFCLFRYQ